jgi:hypothetical protein
MSVSYTSWRFMFATIMGAKVQRTIIIQGLNPPVFSLYEGVFDKYQSSILKYPNNPWENTKK